MAIAVDDLLKRARVHLHDERASSYRYTDEQLVEYANDFQNMALAARPDLFIDAGFLVTSVDIGESIPIDEQFFNAAVYYVVGTAMLREDEFSDDGRATALLGRSLTYLSAGAPQ